MDNIQPVCRICVELNFSLKLLSDVQVECMNSVSISDILKFFVGSKMIDFTQCYICSECIEKATSSYKFKILCDESNEKYERYIEVFKTESIESQDVNEEKDLSDDDLPLSYFTNEIKRNEFCMNIDRWKGIKSSPKRRNRKKSNLKDLGKNDLSVCRTCNKFFSNKYVLIAHEKRHENKGKFICNECNKRFDSKGCLNRHIKVHTGEKKFQCTECQRCFSSSNNLRLHSRRHSGIKPYLCTQCGKSFSHPTGLSYHLRTHTRERPYGCEICEKAFLIKSHLDRHKKIHTGERPFICSQCDRAFIKKIDLQRHEQIHSGKRPHVCKICYKSFLRVLHLNYHMMVHTSERPHRCNYCGKGFIRRYNLNSHVKKSHLDEKTTEAAGS